MADLPDWFSSWVGLPVKADSFTNGLDVNKPALPGAGDIYLALDTDILYICVAAGTWTGFDASIITQGTLAYVRLALTNSLLTADIKSTEFNVASKLVKLDGSALVPVAQIPDLSANKITSDRLSISRLPAGTSGQVLTGQGDGSDPAYTGGFTRSKLGTFTNNTSNGTQAITGVGFAPEFIIVANAGLAQSIGVYDGTRKVAVLLLAGIGISLSGTVIMQPQTDSGNYINGDFASLDSDGFTITWSGKTGTAPTRTFFYIALKTGG